MSKCNLCQTEKPEVNTTQLNCNSCMRLISATNNKKMTDEHLQYRSQNLLVHNIWVGPITNSKDFNEVTEFYRKFGDKYKFWCFSENEQRKFQQKSANSMNCKPGLSNYDPFPQNSPDNLCKIKQQIRYIDYSSNNEESPIEFLMALNPAWGSILTKLMTLEAYSAVKDILSIVILYMYGGYYFDLNVNIDNLNMSAYYTLASEGKFRAVAFKDAIQPDGMYILDVWLLYAQKDTVFLKKWLEYLFLQWSFCLITSDKNTSDLVTRNLKIMFGLGYDDSDACQRHDRDSIIGKNIIDTLLLALGLNEIQEKEAHQFSPLLLQQVSKCLQKPRNMVIENIKRDFFLTKTTGRGQDSVPMLGVCKYYENSWREKDASKIYEKYKGAADFESTSLEKYHHLHLDKYYGFDFDSDENYLKMQIAHFLANRK